MNRLIKHSLHSFDHLLRAVSMALLCAVIATGADDNATRDFGFQPLEIYDFDNGTTRLHVEDINGDGLDDIIFVNNHVSRLEILLRKQEEPSDDSGDLPELEDQFEKKGMIVDQHISALRIADMNEDGKLDLLTFGKEIGLLLRLQQNKGGFTEPLPIFIKKRSDVRTIQTGDLDGDGTKDILICRRDKADILWGAKENAYQTRKTLTFSSDSSYYGDIVDVNEDGINDLAFYFVLNRYPLRIRFGMGEGLFGTEQPVDLPPRKRMEVLQQEGETPQIGMVLKNRLAFRLYDFIKKEQSALAVLQEASPSRIGLEGINGKVEPAWLVADFNSDGFDDLLIAAPELSRLHLYKGAAEGLEPEPQRIDTLSDVSSLSRLANGDVVVISKKEKIAAVHSAAELERFPTILKTPGSVLAGCAVGDSCWFACKNDDGDVELIKLESDSNAISIYSLDMKNEPSGLLAFSLPENQTGLILFRSYDTPRMQLFSDGELTELTSESFRALTLQLKPSNVRVGAAGDGRVLTISKGAVARRFEWQNGRYEVTRQYNPENPRGELIASSSYHLVDDSEGVLFYDRNAGDLVRFSNETDDWGKIHIPDANKTIFNIVQLKNGERDIIILLDRTGINEILGNGKRLSAIAEAEYISPSEKPYLSYAKAIKLGSPPRPMIALVDPANRAIELISRENGDLKKELIFEVFLESDFVRTSKAKGIEPHDVESGDLNGDGIGDLVVLSQDKLLIYLGE